MSSETLCSCGRPKEAWQTHCYACFKAKSKEDTERSIQRQVFIKVAGNQLTNATAEQIIEYSKELEKCFNQWI